MRQLNVHKENPVNELVTVTVIDSPEGAPTTYQVTVPAGPNTTLNFQNGLVSEVGVNGVTNEALLAIVLDRLQAFQKGSFACRENALAITKIEEALMWLLWRTSRRIAAGTEGTKLPD